MLYFVEKSMRSYLGSFVEAGRVEATFEFMSFVDLIVDD